MKEGFYKSSKRILLPDNYGGVSFTIEGYYILAFTGTDLYFFVSTGSNPKWSVFQKSQGMRKISGKVCFDDNSLSCTMLNPNLNSNLILKGKYNDNNLLIKGYYDNDPSDIWLQDTFEYIGTGKED
jgi:hypothetical protein